MEFDLGGKLVTVSLREDLQGGDTQGLKVYDPGAAHKPDFFRYQFQIHAAVHEETAVSFRIPWYAKKVRCLVDAQEITVPCKPSSFFTLERIWNHSYVTIEIYKEIEMVKIPGSEYLTAFMDGPYTLAALCDEEITWTGSCTQADKMLRPIDARHWRDWHGDYMTVGLERNIRFRRICEICDESYTLYFHLADNPSE